MSVTRFCEECGVALPPRAPAGLCPKCLLGQAVKASAESAVAGSAVGTPSEPAPGSSGLRRLGDYELLEKIAAGGMGVVYKARQLSLNRIVALKMIPPGRLASEEAIARFQAEAEAAASLQHPHIVAIHETGQWEDQHYFSMDYVAGNNLADAVRSQPLPPVRAAQILKAIAEAVHYAHQKGILHRDLKPSNIILDEAGEPRVTDFGLAKRLEHSQLSTTTSQLTLTGQVIGSPGFLPPEQAGGRQSAADVRSDVYGLGAVLYYVLASRPPFQADTLTTLLKQVLETEPVAPRLLNPSVPHDLENICLKCLEKEPPRRYPTAQDLAEDLGRFLNRQPVQARPVGSAGKTWRWCRRNPRLATAVGLALLSLLTGLAGVSWQWRRAEAARVRAEANEKKAQTEAARSAQVAQFMKQMLAGVGPDVALGRDTTILREILDRTAERLANDLTDQPEVQAELLLTIGFTCATLGEYAEAEVLTREAVRLRKSVFSETNALVAESLYTLAVVLGRRDTSADRSEAEALLRQALAIQRRLLGDEHRAVAGSLTLLAGILRVERKLVEAEALSRQALTLRKKLLGSEAPEVANSLNNLGLVLGDQGRLDEAEGAVREALAIAQKMPGDQRPDLALTLRYLAGILSRQGKLAEAESAWRQALPMGRKMYGEGSIYTQATLKELATCLGDQRKYAELAALYRESLALLRKTSGNEHPKVVTLLKDLAGALGAQGKLAEAEEASREALAIHTRKSLMMENSVLASATSTGLLLTGSTVRADAPYTSTGWVKGSPVPPLAYTNAANQVRMRGSAQLVAVQSTDARLTGNRHVFANASYQADGTALLWGNAYQQVGTFDVNTNFTPTAGLWEIEYSGVMQPDYSLQLGLAGYGSGGAVDGQRIVETMTRDAASGPVDPAVPYLYTGTLKPTPVKITQTVDDFDNNSFTGGGKWGKGTIVESNQQFNVFGDFQLPTRSIYDSFVFGGPSGQSVILLNRMTREWRADLVSLEDNATNTAILAVSASLAPGYAFHQGRDFAFLLKWSSSFSMSVLWCDRAALPHTNVILALALTRVQPILVITARVLDKANPDTVIFQRSVVDTPGSDPTLSVSQFQALTGMNLTEWVSDAAEAPPAVVMAALGVFQYTDGSAPVPKAVFDNLELRTSEIPFVGY